LSELRLREGLTWREIDGEVVAVDAVKSTYLSANAAGSMLWDALSREATRDTLADGLVERFGIERKRALEDVDRFLDELRSEGLLEGSA
jgi:Coenzyme PQQ synthesis protein D (PqqD)